MELIIGDMKVCDCLSKHNKFLENVPPVNKPTVTQQKSELIEREKKKIANLNAIQAVTHSSTKYEIDESLLVYGGQEVRAKLKKEAKPGETIPKISANILDITKISPANSSWQCVTFQEYSVQRELPADNNFFKMLQGSTAFKPDEWDKNKLKDKYDGANEADRDLIRMKLTFLSRNPIFESIFKASPSAKFPEAKINEKKNELFGILKLLSPAQASKCFEVINGCLNEVRNSPAYSDYSNKIGAFILNDDVIDISSAQASADYFAELQRITSQETVQGVPTSPEGYFNYLQNSNRDVSITCTGATVEASCYSKFDSHCEQVQEMDKRVKKGIRLNSAELAEILREEANTQVDMDPATNAEFRNFNDKICNTASASASGESLTFFQYKDKICKDSPAPECKDRRKLLDKYLSQYGQGTEAGDRNLRSSFQTILSGDAPIAISEAQVRAANNVSETPAELRARFNGRIPEISPSGQLVPPTTRPNPIAQRSEVTSSSTSSDDSSPDFRAASTSNSAAAGSVSPVSSGLARAPASGNTTKFDIPEYQPLAPKAKAVARTGLIQAPRNVTNNPIQENYQNDVPNQFNNGAQNVEAPVTSSSDVTPATASSGGGGSVASASTQSGGSLKAGGSGGAGGSAAQFVGSRPISTRGNPEKSLLFKYGLDQKAEPEVVLVSRDQQTEIKVNVDRTLIERIKNNPNAMEIDEEDLKKIFASPDDIVELKIETGSEEIKIYAKKDSYGGLSFSLTPVRMPASTKGMRASVKADVYDLISKNPDVYLNQNEVIMSQIMNSRIKGNQIIEIISAGKPALKFEAVKQDEFIYKFRPRK